MQNFSDLLKIFIEKHLIPTMVSVVSVILTLLLLPEENWIINKIGKSLFITLIFCVYFLVIQLIVKIIKAIEELISKISENNYYNKQKEKENNEAIQKINEFIDQLSPEDKKILISFVKNGNKILIDYERIRLNSYNSLLGNSNIINVSTYVGDVSKIDRSVYWTTPELEQNVNSGMIPLAGLKQYKIKDLVFNDLEFIYKTTGKLGNF